MTTSDDSSVRQTPPQAQGRSFKGGVASEATPKVDWGYRIAVFFLLLGLLAIYMLVALTEPIQ